MDRKPPQNGTKVDMMIDLSKPLDELLADCAVLGPNFQNAIRAVHTVIEAAQKIQGITIEVELTVPRNGQDPIEVLTCMTLPPVDPDQGGSVRVEGIPLQNLDIDTNVRKVFAKSGLQKVGDLMNKSAEELLLVRGVGPKTLAKIRAILAQLGVSLKDNESNKSSPQLRVYRGEDEP